MRQNLTLGVNVKSFWVFRITYKEKKTSSDLCFEAGVNQESEFKMQRHVHTDVLLTEHVPIETVGREATWCFGCQHRCLRAFGVYTWDKWDDQ